MAVFDEPMPAFFEFPGLERSSWSSSIVHLRILIGSSAPSPLGLIVLGILSKRNSLLAYAAPVDLNRISFLCSVATGVATLEGYVNDTAAITCGFAFTTDLVVIVVAVCGGEADVIIIAPAYFVKFPNGVSCSGLETEALAVAFGA